MQLAGAADDALGAECVGCAFGVDLWLAGTVGAADILDGAAVWDAAGARTDAGAREAGFVLAAGGAAVVARLLTPVRDGAAPALKLAKP